MKNIINKIKSLFSQPYEIMSQEEVDYALATSMVDVYKKNEEDFKGAR
jgi:hypothetical protein